jgi:putative resolvase
VERLLGEQRADLVVLYGWLSGRSQQPAFSDRLTRFGLSYLRALFSGYGVTLTMLSPDEDKTAEEELIQDLLAIIASFAGRLYGVRSRKQKQLLACAQRALQAKD